jgi:hypothetical protein
MKKSISILVPTRNRPQGIKELCESIFTTADNPNTVEVLIYFDLDDSHIPECLEYFKELSTKYIDPIKTIIGPKLILSDYPNKLLQIASSDVFLNSADDVRYKTQGWDTAILKVFDEYPDKLVMVYPDDGHHGPTFAPTSALHRNWVNTVGYFYPPIFDWGYSDTWLYHISIMIDRKVFVPVLTEHLHWSFNKSELDSTYQEKLPKANCFGELYTATEYLRDQDIKKLQQAIKCFGT